jgi:hypothetical protein
VQFGRHGCLGGTAQEEGGEEGTEEGRKRRRRWNFVEIIKQEGRKLFKMVLT